MPSQHGSKLAALLIFACYFTLQPVVLADGNLDVIFKFNGNLQDLQWIAARNGLVFKEKVPGFSDIYIFEDPEGFFDQRNKRGQNNALNYFQNLHGGIEWAAKDEKLRRSKRTDFDDSSSKQDDDNNMFNDELWSMSWHMNGQNPQSDINVLPVFKNGYTGKGIRIVIADDGLDHKHVDLKENYDPMISFDFNGNDGDPTPVGHDNQHGTMCAGLIVMKPNNTRCGVGVAYNARIGGIRLLDGDLTDVLEGRAFTYNHEMVDIYSTSWGPEDDGTIVDGPRFMGKEALLKGVTEGRRGKGIVYVWAGGNGGLKNDSCAFDGYVNSPYTLPINSVDHNGVIPWYAEPCAAIVGSTPSSGKKGDYKIVSAAVNNTCSTKFSGTSASAPIAAGIIALALEANKNLSWRDVQHLLIFSANHNSLPLVPQWTKNAVDLYHNPYVGFGLLDARGIVEAALNWENVPYQSVCNLDVVTPNAPMVFSSKGNEIHFETSACQGTINEVRALELVEITLTVEYPKRKKLEITLISPNGTPATLLFRRPLDNSREGFRDLAITSVVTWGECPLGRWTFRIEPFSDSEENLGVVTHLAVSFRGTKWVPWYLRGRSRCISDPQQTYVQK